jgi:hypothetical protein
MKRKRHVWGIPEEMKFTVQQRCANCGMYRIKALGIWMYSFEETTPSNPFVETLKNLGCNPIKPKK